MKKFLALVIAIVSMLSIMPTVGIADGDTTGYAFGFTASTDGKTLSRANQWQIKRGTCPIIEVRHKVIGNGSSAGHTNLMYACVIFVDAVSYVGSKWQLPNGIYWSCTSNILADYTGASVVPGGRGNTKYKEINGLNSVRLEGQFRPH